MSDAAQSRGIVSRAMAYPYEPPPRSFLLTGTGPGDISLLCEAPPGGDSAALLAYGSNASPAVLARKLGSSLSASPLAVLRATLADFDVVYSAHVSVYGAVPATLQRSPGTEVHAFVAFPDAEQLALIAETEPNYELVALEALSCRLEGGAGLGSAHAFLSRHGCLLDADREIALAAVPARRRALPTMDQREALELVRGRLAPESDLERFVLAAATDANVARRRTERLRRGSRQLAPPPPQVVAKRRSARRASSP